MATLPVGVLAPDQPFTISFQGGENSGDEFDNDGGVLLFVFNSGTSNKQITFLAQTDPHGDPQVLDRVALATGGGATTIMPALNPKWFNDFAGRVQVRYEGDDATGISVAAIRVKTARPWE